MLFGVAGGADEFKIYLKTSPAQELLRPFADPVNIALLVTHADGRPLEQGNVAIVLDAPKSGPFLATDFPVVEGSRLLEMALPLRQGRAQWKYLFPIRGDYHLSVTLNAAGATAQSQSFVIPVLENRAKWLWLSLFCAGLFLVGFAAGRIFTATSALAPTLSVILLLGGFATVSSHDGPARTEPAANPPAGLEIAAASVGKPTRLHWRSSESSAPNALLSLSVFHLEKHKTVFAIDKVPVAGDYSVDFHFPDGAEYRVNSIAEVAGQAPLRTEQLVAVTGVEPPMTAQVPALLLFLAVIALGLGAGRFSKTLAAR